MSYTIPLPPDKKDIIQSPRARMEEEVNQAIHKYLDTYSEITVGCYKNDIDTFFSLVNKSLMECTEFDIIDYIKKMEQHKYSNATINRKIYSLSKIFTIYQKLGLVKKNLVRELSKTTRINKKVARTIELSIQKEDVIKTINHSTPKTSLIIKALSNTGLRVSELLNITYDDIKDFNEHYFKVKILGKGDKIRYIFLSKSLFHEIRSVYNFNSPHLFHSQSGKRLSRTNIYHQISKAFMKHTSKEATPHTLRHFFSTYKIGTERKDVKSVSNYLGHSRVAITLEMYTHTSLSAEESHII